MGTEVHFAFSDGHLSFENAELEAKHQKYKDRVVIRGDIVKDDSGSLAVFTEQGSSASQMTAAKIMDIISRLLACDGQAADAVSAETRVKMEDALKLLKIPISERPAIWIRLPRHNWSKSCSSIEDPVVLDRNLNGHLWQAYGKSKLRKSFWKTVGRRFPFGNAYSYSLKRVFPICVCGWHKNWLDRNKTLIRCGNYSTKKSIWEKEHLSLIMFTLDALRDIVK